MASHLYHEGNRALQDAFDSRRIADRLESVTLHTAFTERDRSFIESLRFFFLATADKEGHPDVSFKGGAPGFVRVVGDNELAFPDYDGNGMFKSLGNLSVNPTVGLLFIDFESPRRLRVQGRAAIRRDDPLLATIVGAQLIVRVTATAIFPNCPRYIPTMRMIEPSIYTPHDGVAPVEPGWKSEPEFADAVHPRQAVAGVAWPSSE
ncbi:MAG: pyridoxamine 5'-phosphate oxidase family protein [Bauldia sp.]|nr:pyridoxamine 5'-phosphate oxidase family protein [Bauldia sp.]